MQEPCSAIIQGLTCFDTAQMGRLTALAAKATLGLDEANRMNVHLTPELEQLVQSRVESGRYGSAGEVVRDALRLLADRDELLERRKQELRLQIAQGLDSLQRGEGVDGGEFFAELEREEATLLAP
jgi:antitoxin ParD1/3/4